MTGFLAQFIAQTKKIWGSLGLGPRVTLLSFAGLMLLLVVVLAIWSAQPDYVLAWSGLAPEDAAALSAQLNDDKIHFRYEPSRGAIYVPAAQVNTVRLNAASKGLLRSTSDSGFGDFDKNTFGQTEFVQKIKYLGALQNMLAGTIRSIEGVEAAKVTVCMAPEEALYTREKQEAKASVIVTMRGGRSLTGEQVRTIGNLVASSVPKLDPRRVQISDSTGRPYTHLQEEDGGGAGMTDEQLEATKRMESHFSEKIQTLLDQVLGAGLAAVRVTAQLNFEKVERKTEKRDPDSKVTLEDSSQTNDMVGGSLAPSGPPGVKINTQPNEAAGIAQSRMENSDKRKNTVKKYAYDYTLEDVKPEVGSVKSLSVVVLLSPTKDEKGVVKPLKEPIRVKLENIVKASVAAVPNHNVRVEYVEDPFTTAVPLAPVASAPVFGVEWLELLKSHLSDIFALAGIVAMVLILRRVLAKSYVPPPRSPETEALTAAAAAAATMGTVGQKQPPAMLMQENLKRLITQNNAQAVNIIRSMLK